MPIITATKQNIKSMFDLVKYSFNKTDYNVPESFTILAQNSMIFGHQNNNIVTNQIIAIPKTTQLAQQKVTTAGIGYVASYPEARGQGGIKSLFLEAFQEMQQQQIALSYLAPFSQTFYRHLGYENAFWQKQYTFDKNTWSFLTKVPKAKFTRFTFTDQEQMSQIYHLYDQLLATKDGNLKRETWWWQYLATKKTNYQFAVALDENNNSYAYIAYEFQGSTFIIHELAYPNFQSLCQLLEFASRHLSTFNTFTYTGSVKEDLTTCFTDNQFIDIKLKPYMMTRIIDIQAFFKQIKSILPTNLSFTFKVNDKDCPWNNHIFQYHNGQLFQNDQITTIDFEADIQTWSAIFLNTITPTQAIDQGKLITYNTQQLNWPTLFADLTLIDYF